MRSTGGFAPQHDRARTAILEIAAHAERPLPLVLNSNMYMTPAVFVERPGSANPLHGITRIESAPAFADFDDDGLMDVFVTNDTEPDFLFRNLGDGTFEEAVTIGSGDNPFSVVVGDFDGDGDDDPEGSKEDGCGYRVS